MSEEVLVKVEGVSKKFCRSLKKSLWYGVCDIASELLPFGKSIAEDKASPSASLRKDEFFAVNDVSFELRRGECLGLIGRNGAGKTTLLKMLNGLIKPDSGTITMRGRIGALIALGAGFNPVLTGRENIYVNGSVLGLSKREIDEKIEEIIEFSEIREFIDSPVQSYSSGMSVRLGFAIATSMKPDVLILDEVLAVGDASFRAKCYSRLSQIAKSAAIIFVSHNMDQVGQICSEVLVMKQGHQVFHGNVASGIEVYDSVNNLTFDEGDRKEYLSPGVKLLNVEVPTVIEYGHELNIKIVIDLPYEIEQGDIKITIFNNRGHQVAESYSKRSMTDIKLKKSVNEINIQAGPFYLRASSYQLSLVVLDRRTNEHIYWGSRFWVLRANGPSFGSADSLPPLKVSGSGALCNY